MWPVLASLVVAASLDVAAPPRIEALEDDGVKGLRATFLVAAPADHVLATLWDVRRFKDVFPDIHSLEVVRDGGEELDVRFFVDAVLADVTYTLRRHRDPKSRTISWRNIAGDIKYIRGSWTVKPTADPNVSEVIYTSFVDVMAVVPTALVRDTAIKKAEQMATRVRGACRPARIADVKTDAAATASRPPLP